MPNDEKSVNESDSLPEQTQESESVTGSEDSLSPSDVEKRIRNLKSEYERKYGTQITELTEKVNSLLQEKEERLEELESKSRLTSDERDELGDLELEISQIKRDKRSKAWLKVTEETSDHVAKKHISEYDKSMAEYRLRKMAKASELPEEKFESEIIKYMQRVDPLAKLPGLVRLEEAYDLYSDEMKMAKDRQEKTKPQFTEQASRAPRPQSRQEILDNAIGSKRNDNDAMMLLKNLHAVQDEATSR